MGRINPKKLATLKQMRDEIEDSLPAYSEEPDSMSEEEKDALMSDLLNDHEKFKRLVNVAARNRAMLKAEAITRIESRKEMERVLISTGQLSPDTLYNPYNLKPIELSFVKEYSIDANPLEAYRRAIHPQVILDKTCEKNALKFLMRKEVQLAIVDERARADDYRYMTTLLTKEEIMDMCLKLFSEARSSGEFATAFTIIKEIGREIHGMFRSERTLKIEERRELTIKDGDNLFASFAARIQGKQVAQITDMGDAHVIDVQVEQTEGQEASDGRESAGQSDEHDTPDTQHSFSDFQRAIGQQAPANAGSEPEVDGGDGSGEAPIDIHEQLPEVHTDGHEWGAANVESGVQGSLSGVSPPVQKQRRQDQGFSQAVSAW